MGQSRAGLVLLFIGLLAISAATATTAPLPAAVAAAGEGSAVTVPGK